MLRLLWDTVIGGLSWRLTHDGLSHSSQVIAVISGAAFGYVCFLGCRLKLSVILVEFFKCCSDFAINEGERHAVPLDRQRREIDLLFTGKPFE
ncbi:hypothetical protein SAMN03159376_01848 [Pseudomonas sp. NFACC09-4]|nr:hypothetical protein SAMN03159376_01848 [Pseudomonas sp. NFACC09-4]